MKVGCWVRAQAGFLPGCIGASRDGGGGRGGRVCGKEEVQTGLREENRHWGLC